MTRLKNAKAFTLIELIVVIVIIGILVAIAAVAYNSIIANSKKSSLEASAAQVAKIAQAQSAANQTVITVTDVTAAAFKTTVQNDGLPTSGAGAVTIVDDTATADRVFEVQRDGFEVKVTLSDVAGGAATVAKAATLTAGN